LQTCADMVGGGQLAGVHVLVVEDDPDSGEVISACLGGWGGAVVSGASSAEEALALLDRVRPDVLVADLSMPDHDGFWLIGQIRNRRPESGGLVPAIALTAHGFMYPRGRVLAAGYDERLRKPFDPQELCGMVAMLARSARAA
jgi:CheY-like chemotaxis protein